MSTPPPPIVPGSPERDSGGAPWARRVYGAALLLGLLRFVHLGRWSLWIDEVFTWGDSHHAASAVNQLGYLIIRWTVEALGGTPTEAALRLAPAVFGFLAVPLTYWAFHPLSGRTRAAGAALVVAISAWEIQWSQTARFYTMVQALGLVGAGLVVRGALQSRWLLTILGISVAGLGILFHLSGAVVAAAIGLAAFLIPPSQAASANRLTRLAFMVFAVPGLLALPFVWSVWQTYLEKKVIEDPLSGVVHFALSTGASLTPTLAALALVAWVLAFRARDRAGIFTGLVAVVGGASLAALSAFATVSAQYAFGLFPWIALLASWSLVRGERVPTDGVPSSGSSSLRVGWLLALVLPLVVQSTSYFMLENGQRPLWREAVEIVAARRSPSDVVVAAPAPVVEFYLTGARETDVRHHDAVVQLDRFNPRPYETLAAEGRTAWFVVRNDYNLSMPRRDRESFEGFLTERCDLVEDFNVFAIGRDLSISVWRFDPAH